MSLASKARLTLSIKTQVNIICGVIRITKVPEQKKEKVKPVDVSSFAFLFPSLFHWFTFSTGQWHQTLRMILKRRQSCSDNKVWKKSKAGEKQTNKNLTVTLIKCHDTFFLSNLKEKNLFFCQKENRQNKKTMKLFFSVEITFFQRGWGKFAFQTHQNWNTHLKTIWVKQSWTPKTLYLSRQHFST